MFATFEEGLRETSSVRQEVPPDRQHDEDDRRVDVGRHEGGLQAARRGVQDHAPRDQERRQVDVHAREGVHRRRTAQQQHGGHDDVGQEGKEDEGDVRGVPQRAFTISHMVCAVRDLRFTSMARMPKSSTWIVAPLAYQKGPETP